MTAGATEYLIQALSTIKANLSDFTLLYNDVDNDALFGPQGTQPRRGGLLFWRVGTARGVKNR